jgi:hypothetical protein
MNFLSSFLSDPSKLAPVVTKAFGMFDKDHSGTIDRTELDAVLGKVCSMVGMSPPPASAVNSVFAKAGGPDGKVSKEEFSKLVLDLFAMVSGKEKAAAAPGAAAPAAPAAASGGFGGLGNMLGGAGGGAAPSGGGYPSLGGL